MSAQVIYVSTLTRLIYRLDLATCTYDLVAPISGFNGNDLTFHPDGNVYGIASGGTLYRIDTLSGVTTPIHQFSGQSFNSLTTDAGGLFYATGNQGFLWTYDPNTGQEALLGNIGYRATGDLTFFGGNLYMAAEDDQIVQVNLENPAASTVIFRSEVAGDIFGIVSFAETCDSIEIFAIGGQSTSQIYRINLQSQSLEPYCEVDLQIGGGASTYEFLAAAPILLDSIITDTAACGAADGTLELFARGGIGSLQYAVNGGPFQGSPRFDGLAAGSYPVAIIDGSGCRVESAARIPGEPGPELTLENVLDARCTNDNGEIAVSAASPAGTVQFRLNEQAFGAAAGWSGLPGGIYTIIARDPNGCTDTLLQTVDFQPAASIPPFSLDPASCSQPNGQLNFTGPTGNRLFALDDNAFQIAEGFSALEPGSYLLRQLDTFDCLNDTTFFIDAIPAPVISQLEVKPATCGQDNGAVQLLASGGTPPLAFRLEDGPAIENGVFNSLSAGAYSLRINDQSGCVIDTLVTIPQGACPVYVPTAFSPNGDGHNDRFELYSSDDNPIQVESFRIYGRWGNLLYESRNTANPSWDGTARGQAVDTGSYLYHIVWIGSDEQKETLTGTVLLLR